MKATTIDEVLSRPDETITESLRTGVGAGAVQHDECQGWGLVMINKQ